MPFVLSFLTLLSVYHKLITAFDKYLLSAPHVPDAVLEASQWMLGYTEILIPWMLRAVGVAWGGQSPDCGALLLITSWRPYRFT